MVLRYPCLSRCSPLRLSTSSYYFSSSSSFKLSFFSSTTFPSFRTIHVPSASRKRKRVKDEGIIQNPNDTDVEGSIPHVPVMAREVVHFICSQETKNKKSLFVDCTFGRGGHTRALLESFPQATVIGIDRDFEAFKAAREVRKQYGDRFFFVLGSFASVLAKLVSLQTTSSVSPSTSGLAFDSPLMVQEILAKILATSTGGVGGGVGDAPADKFRGVDAVLMDLGVSTPQIADADRGFSFRWDLNGPLDMRMAGQEISIQTDRDGRRLLKRQTEEATRELDQRVRSMKKWEKRELASSQKHKHEGLTAFDVVNTFPEGKLADILWRFGEERRSRKIARAIVARREGRSPPIEDEQEEEEMEEGEQQEEGDLLEEEEEGEESVGRAEQKLNKKTIEGGRKEPAHGRDNDRRGFEKRQVHGAAGVRGSAPLTTTEDSRIYTTHELAQVVRRCFSGKERRESRIDVATRTFQALRIFVNDELNQLREGLRHSEELLAPGRRIIVISFHSLEDRIVKDWMHYASGRIKDASRAQPSLSLVSHKPFTPSPEEVEQNPKCRSAKMRVAERLSGPPVGAKVLQPEELYL